MKLIALLPMKAHSERVPNKNMKVFHESPLYHKVLSVLLQSEYISSVVINTDSEVIRKDALKNFERVVVIERPVALQGDFVSMNNIIAYDLSRTNGDHFLQTHCTNPLICTPTVDRAIETYFNQLYTFDSLFSVTRLQTRLYREDGSPINHNPKKLVRTQDLSPVFEENSNFYIFSRKSFAEAENCRIGLKPQMFEVNKLEAMDIDEPEDWEMARILFERQSNK
jgi:CMP-N-acetylneuraminic acid synthetase